MGRVDLALRREGGFERLYAVKRLHSQYQSDEAFLAMFLDEARIAGLVRHANVVSVLDVGEDDGGPFLVMDYVDGLPLNRIIERHRGRDEFLPVQLCVRMVAQVAEGLHAAHELTYHDGRSLGLVHRDVSPQNILVGYDGVVRVVDFGVAKALGRLTRTATGVLKGKFGYMSPEQLRFEEPDRRSDLFSLGVVLYELLACRRLYAGGEGMEAARRVLNEPPPDIDDVRQDVPMELVQLLFELLAKNPDHRPETAQRVAQRLDDVLSDVVAEEGRLDVTEYMETVFGEERAKHQQWLTAQIRDAEASATNARPANPEAPVPRGGAHTEEVRRQPLRWGLGVGLALVLAGIGGAVVWATTEPNAEPDEAAQATMAADVGAVEERAATPVVEPEEDSPEPEVDLPGGAMEAPEGNVAPSNVGERGRRRRSGSTRSMRGSRPWVDQW